jgi:hypothetical protein
MSQDLTELITAFYEQPTSKGLEALGTTFIFTTLTQEERQGVVNQSSATHNAAYLQATTLELTALGTNIDMHGTWAPYPGTNITAWSEVGTGGRTMYSQIVQRGYLYPLGHKAILTKIFQRVLAVDPSNPISGDSADFPVAYLQERQYITVTEKIKTYPATGQPFPVTPEGAAAPLGTTDWPFQTVRMVTTTTPPLSATPSFGTIANEQALWPQVPSGNSNADVMWSFVATDLAGRDVAFNMPLVFVYGGDGSSFLSEFDTEPSGSTPCLGQQLATNYAALSNDARYWSTIGGVPMQFAPGPGGISPSSATTHPTLLIALGGATTRADVNSGSNAPPSPASSTTLTDAFQPNFYPTIRTTRVRLHVAEALTGAPFTDTPIPANPQPWGNIGGVQFEYFSGYVAGGTSSYGRPNAGKTPELPAGVSPNLGSVYAAASNVGTSTPTTGGTAVPLGVPLNIPANTVGGIGTPNLGVTGLSAESGTVGGTLANYAKSGSTDISEYFPSKASLGSASQVVSSLLGGLNLGDILAGTGLKGAAPTVTSQTDPSTGQLTVTYAMSAPLQTWPTSDSPPPYDATPGIFVPDDTENGMMYLNTIVTSTPPGTPTYTTTGSIDPFTINLIGDDGSLDFFLIHFESVSFTAGNGGKPTVVVNIDQTEFEGCLSFINQLSQFLQALGVGGMTVDVEANAVTVSMTMSLPDVDMGMLTMTGLSFSGGVMVPFIDGVSTATFSFASQANPFTLTVCCFGGGGFVALAVGFGGIQSVQAQFEFTGTLALDLYVAAGSVSLSAGIYFSYYSASNPGPMGVTGVTLTGFVHITGQVQILGIITVTVTVQLSLSYNSDSGEVTGTATVSVSISICGFGVSVGFSVTKSFAGSSGSGGPLQGSSRHALDSGYQPPPLVWDDLMDLAEFQTYCSAFSN